VTASKLGADDGSVRAPRDSATGKKTEEVPALPRRMGRELVQVLDKKGKPVFRAPTAEELEAKPELGPVAVVEWQDQEQPWHEFTLAWWAEVWRSPMASEFYRVDVHRLYIIADLVDRYWWAPAKELAAEIRLQERAFGLDPMARRSLQWEARGGPGTDEGKVKKAPVKRQDPRKTLRIVGE
jgi:hypothetical protein